MGKQLRGLLYFYTADMKFSLKVFWIILMSILVLSLLASYLLIDVEGGFFTYSLTGPMYIYCGIYGFICVKEWVPFAIKMGGTRKNIMVSLGVFFLGLSFTMAIIGSTLQELINMLTKLMGIDTFIFLHLAYFLDDTWYHRLAIDTSIMFFSFSLLFIVGLLFYRYGIIGGGSVVGLIFLAGVIGLAKGWIIDFFIDVFQNINLLYFGQLALLGLIFYLLSWLLLKKITTIKVR